MRAERDNLADQSMLAIRGHVEARQLLALLAGKNDIDLRQARNNRGLDARNFPRQVRLIPKLLVEKCVDGRL